MCSDPQTFINKETGEANIGACRKCDECIAARRHQWVSRGMAELACWPHALSVTLTYDDSTQENRDAAAMFAYGDVRAFLQRLRAAINRLQPGGRLRFICAGEQGSRNGRCHWHLIIYSDVDLTRLGKFRARGHFVTHRRDMITVGKRKRRLQWDLWGKGFVTVQEPDEAAMHYVLSYCLKDQFTVEKSEGTARHAKAEDFATGLFRMSKRPAIGEAWLWRKLEGLEASGAVLPHLRLKVPGLSGYYYPTGSMREKLLWGLVALNQRVIWATGRNAPQWSSLLASVQDSPADLEVLCYGKENEQEEEAAFLARIDLDGREGFHQHQRAEKRRRCGGSVPCVECLRSLSGEQLYALNAERYFDQWGQAQFRPKAGGQYCDPRPDGKGVNPYCQERGSRLSRFTFPDSDRSDLSRGL